MPTAPNTLKPRCPKCYSTNLHFAPEDMTRWDEPDTFCVECEWVGQLPFDDDPARDDARLEDIDNRDAAYAEMCQS